MTTFSIKAHLVFADTAWLEAVPSGQEQAEQQESQIFLCPLDLLPSQVKATRL